MNLSRAPWQKLLELYCYCCERISFVLENLKLKYFETIVAVSYFRANELH